MRFTLRTAFVGSSLILLSHACGKRDQYDRATVPANPDRAGAALVSQITPPNTEVTSVPGQPGAEAPVSATISPAEIVSKVSSWNGKPVVWNESVGNIKLGETDWESWYTEYDTYRREGRVTYGFRNFDASGNQLCNEDQRNGANVCTTVAGVLILQNYEGTLAMPKEDGSFVNVPMNQRLDEVAFSKADREGTLIEGENVNSSTRGREFFKRFFNTYVAPRYTTSTDVDCFAEGRCNYALISGYYGWFYSAPGGMSGHLFLTRDKNSLYQAEFVRFDSKPVPKSLYSEGSSVDLLNGQINLPGARGQSFGLGQSYDAFQKIGLPPITWGGFAGATSLEYSGFYVSFEKKNAARFTDVNYSQAEAGDTASYFQFDENFGTEIRFGKVPLSLLNQDRATWSKAEHLKALEDLRLAAEQQILANPEQGGEILSSQIVGGDQLSKIYGGYQLVLNYRFQGKVLKLTYTTYLKRTDAIASIEIAQSYEENLLEAQVNPKTGHIDGFGPLLIGEPLTIKDLDLDYTNRATVLIGETPVRVALTKLQQTTVARPNLNSNLPDLFVYNNVLKFAVGGVTVDLVPCKVLPGNPNSGYCVLSLYSTQFYIGDAAKAYTTQLKELYAKKAETPTELEELSSARRALPDLGASFNTCNGKAQISITERKEAALGKLKTDNCLLLTDTAESSVTDKTVFFVYGSSAAFVLGGENNGFVDGFQFY